MTLSRGEGIIDTPSNHSVDQTVEKLKGILETKGVTLFALVDHSGEAEKAVMKMPPTKLLIFGNPKGGTPLMLAAHSIAIALPLKLLIWEDSQGKVWVSYNSLEYLQQRHGVPQELLQNIAVVESLAAKAGEQSVELRLRVGLYPRRYPCRRNGRTITLPSLLFVARKFFCRVTVSAAMWSRRTLAFS